MKKALSLILALLLCFSLCACGNTDNAKEVSKESLLAQAEQLDFSALNDAIKENIVNARSEYENKTVLITGYVTKISEDAVTLKSHLVYRSPTISVKLSLEDISKLSTDQLVDVVGVIESIPGQDSVNVINGYFVKDTYTLSGKIVFGYLGKNGQLAEINKHSSTIGVEDRWTVQLTETADEYNYYLHKVFSVTHTAGKEISKLNANGIDIKRYDNVTVVAKMRHGFLGCEAYELVSIEKN